MYLGNVRFCLAFDYGPTYRLKDGSFRTASKCSFCNAGVFSESKIVNEFTKK